MEDAGEKIREMTKEHSSRFKSICVFCGSSNGKKVSYQDAAIDLGKELVKRCIEHFPNSEWLVQTEKHISGYYEKIGFKIYKLEETTVLTDTSID